MNKELIKKRFGRKLKSYNENAKIQKQMAEKLLSYLTERKYDTILEIGCGTGVLTEIASKSLNYKDYFANDIIGECEKYIKTINPDIKFICGDIEQIGKTLTQKYDLIISNASFQWISDFSGFIQSILSKLNPDGILLFTTFGKENFREINYVMNKTLNYYSISELKELFKNRTVTIEEDVRILSFKTPKDALKHIQNTGVNAISEENWTKKDLIEFENGYNNFCSNRPTLTYNPIYVKIIN